MTPGGATEKRKNRVRLLNFSLPFQFYNSKIVKIDITDKTDQTEKTIKTDTTDNIPKER